MVQGLFTYRRFIWQSAVAELRHRYAGTGLGVVWNVLHPLALIAVYSIVFTALMRGRVPGVDKRLLQRERAYQRERPGGESREPSKPPRPWGERPE